MVRPRRILLVRLLQVAAVLPVRRQGLARARAVLVHPFEVGAWRRLGRLGHGGFLCRFEPVTSHAGPGSSPAPPRCKKNSNGWNPARPRPFYSSDSDLLPPPLS